MGTNIMANQVKTPIQNYFEKVLYENLTFEIPPLWFFKSSRGIKKIVTSPCAYIACTDLLNYFIRCSINTDDYTSARTDKINSQNKHKI